MVTSSDTADALLVELVLPGGFHGMPTFPFVRGYLEATAGQRVRWLRYGVQRGSQVARAEPGAVLPADDLRSLTEALRTAGAARVVFSQPPAPSLLTALRAARPGVVIAAVSVDGWQRAASPDQIRLSPAVGDILRFLLPGQEVPTEGSALLCRPDFAVELANAAARADRTNLMLLCGRACAYRRPLARSPFFAARSTEPDKAVPCSFCSGVRAWEPAFRETDDLDPAELLRLQLEALARQPGPALPALELRLIGARLEADPETTAQVVAEHSPVPTRLLLEYRADWIVRMSDRIGAAARAMRERGGLGLEVCLVGLESFSAAQLDRYHKGHGPLTNLRALRALAELASGEAPAFAIRPSAGLSTILFDPWATPGEVALTVAAASWLGLEPLCRNLLASRLRLAEGLPLTDAARREGLLLEASPSDPLLATGARTLYDAELPWRFADPRMESLCRLAIRLREGPELAGDRLAAALAAWRLDDGAPALELAERLCHATVASERAQDPESLLAAAKALQADRRKPRERRAHLEQLLAEGGASPSGELLELRLLGRPEEAATLRPLEPLGDRFAYTLLDSSLRDPRGAALAAGQTLAVQPGLIQVLRGPREVAFFALDAVLCAGDGVHDAEFWRELLATGRAAPSATETAGVPAGAWPNTELGRRVADALAAVRQAPDSPLNGWTAEGAARGDAVELVLRRGDDALRLFVRPGDADGAAYRAGHAFKLVYASETPLDDPVRRRLADALADALARDTEAPTVGESAGVCVAVPSDR